MSYAHATFIDTIPLHRLHVLHMHRCTSWHYNYHHLQAVLVGTACLQAVLVGTAFHVLVSYM